MGSILKFMSTLFGGVSLPEEKPMWQQSGPKTLFCAVCGEVVEPQVVGDKIFILPCPCLKKKSKKGNKK
jgi:hypothetical protein